MIYSFSYSTEDLSHMTLKSDAKFDENCNSMDKNPRYVRVEPKNTEELHFMTPNSDAKFEYLNLVVSKMALGVG